MKLLKNKLGFTLIESLLVLVIVGIVFAIVYQQWPWLF